jgi:SAM-dependent methyltransferase
VTLLGRLRAVFGLANADAITARDPFVHGLFPVCVATHDLGIKRLFELSTALSLLACRPGDRVLDLGAGSGFSSETLARLGYTVTAVDPDHAALSNNRRRVAIDATRIDGTVRVAGAYAESLPFASAQFDGIVALNVLHHVADLPAVARELARVLKPGGHVVFCEPGLDHLEEPETKRAIAEHGENDQPFDILAFLALAKSHGFARAYLSATLHPDLRLVPLEETELFASGQHPTPRLRERGVLDELRRCVAFGLLVKDGERERTSRYPGVLRATLEVDAFPAPLRRGKTYRTRARITNAGDTRWLAAPSALGGFVTLGCKFVQLDGRVARDNAGRTFLERDVLPGTSVETELVLPVPTDLPPGQYELRVDLVDELICWFSDVPGNLPAAQVIQVV